MKSNPEFLMRSAVLPRFSSKISGFVSYVILSQEFVWKLSLPGLTNFVWAIALPQNIFSHCFLCLRLLLDVIWLAFP